MKNNSLSTKNHNMVAEIKNGESKFLFKKKKNTLIILNQGINSQVYVNLISFDGNNKLERVGEENEFNLTTFNAFSFKCLENSIVEYDLVNTKTNLK